MGDSAPIDKKAGSLASFIGDAQPESPADKSPRITISDLTAVWRALQRSQPHLKAIRGTTSKSISSNVAPLKVYSGAAISPSRI